MFINFSKEDKDKMLNEIQTFFGNERDEEISEFAAENVLEFIKNISVLTFITKQLKMQKVL